MIFLLTSEQAFTTQLQKWKEKTEACSHLAVLENQRWSVVNIKGTFCVILLIEMQVQFLLVGVQFSGLESTVLGWKIQILSE